MENHHDIEKIMNIIKSDRSVINSLTIDQIKKLSKSAFNKDITLRLKQDVISAFIVNLDLHLKEDAKVSTKSTLKVKEDIMSNTEEKINDMMIIKMRRPMIDNVKIIKIKASTECRDNDLKSRLDSLCVPELDFLLEMFPTGRVKGQKQGRVDFLYKSFKDMKSPIDEDFLGSLYDTGSLDSIHKIFYGEHSNLTDYEIIKKFMKRRDEYVEMDPIDDPEVKRLLGEPGKNEYKYLHKLMTSYTLDDALYFRTSTLRWICDNKDISMNGLRYDLMKRLFP